jgi:hypothetical protein
VLLGYIAEAGKLRPTGIREDNVELAFLPLDLCEEAIKIAECGLVGSSESPFLKTMKFVARESFQHSIRTFRPPWAVASVV